MQFSIHTIQSDLTGDFLSQLQSCIDQINLLLQINPAGQQIAKVTVFARCSDNADYLRKMELLDDILLKTNSLKASVSLISQPPVDDKIRMEVWTLGQLSASAAITFKHDNQSTFLLIDCPEFTCLFSTHYATAHSSFNENTREAFRLFDTVLHATGFDYPDLLRQWNYIENIVLVEENNDKPLQHYQIFNDLRSLYYGESDFKNGYPSATGIGTDCGGCTIEAIAFKEKGRDTIRPVTNSFQVDAHSYSSNVLIGNTIKEMKRVSTPKFERGKYVQLDDEGFLFISGTAAIIGEQTVYPDDVSKQTLTTLQNIDHLVSTFQPKNKDKEVTSPPRPVNYRVYLKNESDYEIVKSICDKHWGTDKGFIVIADICRDNLLVEIEANYQV